jgi:PiT family inorganic phosphate transporter
VHLVIELDDVAGAIAGVGTIHRFKAVRWGIAANIVWAWVLTIPASAIIAWITLTLIRLLGPAV